MIVYHECRSVQRDVSFESTVDGVIFEEVGQCIRLCDIHYRSDIDPVVRQQPKNVASDSAKSHQPDCHDGSPVATLEATCTLSFCCTCTSTMVPENTAPGESQKNPPVGIPKAPRLPSERHVACQRDQLCVVAVRRDNGWTTNRKVKRNGQREDDGVDRSGSLHR